MSDLIKIKDLKEKTATYGLPIWQRFYQWSIVLYEQLFNLTLFKGDESNVYITPLQTCIITDEPLELIYKIEYNRIEKNKSLELIKNNNNKLLNDFGHRLKTILNGMYGEYIIFKNDKKMSPYIKLNDGKLELMPVEKTRNLAIYLDPAQTVQTTYISFKKINEICLEEANIFKTTGVLKDTFSINDRDCEQIQNLMNSFLNFPISIKYLEFKTRKEAWNAFKRLQAGQDVSPYTFFIAGQWFKHNHDEYENDIEKFMNEINTQFTTYYKDKDEFVTNLISYVQNTVEIKEKIEDEMKYLKDEYQTKLSIEYVKKFTDILKIILRNIKNIELPHGSLLPFWPCESRRANILVLVKLWEKYNPTRWEKIFEKYYIQILCMKKKPDANKLSNQCLRKIDEYTELQDFESWFNKQLQLEEEFYIRPEHIELKHIPYITSWYSEHPSGTKKKGERHEIVPKCKGGKKTLGNVTCINYRDNPSRNDDLPNVFYDNYNNYISRECIPENYKDYDYTNSNDINKFSEDRFKLVIRRFQDVLDKYGLKYKNLEQIEHNEELPH